MRMLCYFYAEVDPLDLDSPTFTAKMRTSCLNQTRLSGRLKRSSCVDVYNEYCRVPFQCYPGLGLGREKV